MAMQWSIEQTTPVIPVVHDVENCELLPLLQRYIDNSFEISVRNSTIHDECFGGCVHFISSLYVLPVIPYQLQSAGYNKTDCIEITALASAMGCLISSYVTNLPFVIAPVSSVTIYIAVTLQRNSMNQSQGDAAVILSGFALLFIGVSKPLIAVLTKMIPDCIQASTAVGIGMITALSGAIEIDLVVPGRYAILSMGPMSAQIVIALAATTITSVALSFNWKGGFATGLLFGTLIWWCSIEDWPKQLIAVPSYDVNVDLVVDWQVLYLLLNLTFLYLLALSGIARAMSDLSGLTSSDGSIPRGNWLFIMCGLSTILSGYFSGPPILISPESAPAIKSGNARTGLSTLICGLLYSVSVYFCPVFERVPAAATSPILILVGLTLFINAKRINWQRPDEAVPAFFVLLLIPFTYSIISGVGVGYILYLAIGLLTGRLQEKLHGSFCGKRKKWQRWSVDRHETINARVATPQINDTESGGQGSTGLVQGSSYVHRLHSFRSRLLSKVQQLKQPHDQMLLFASLHGEARNIHYQSARYAVSQDLHEDNGGSASADAHYRTRQCTFIDGLPMDLKSSINSIQFSQQ